tara:strand:- start:47 stop:841 length:795 start_codon:yes stop_codon:yes gene_type:complete
MPSLGLGLGLQRSSFVSRFKGLLDTYPDAVGAYSLKALSASWVGQAVLLVNRVADNVDLAVTQTDITDGTLVAFSSGGDVAVKIVYDQSGSSTSNNLFPDSSAKRRLIVDSGVLVTEGGEPAIAGNIYHYNIGGGGISLTTDFSILYLANVNNTSVLLGGNVDAPRIRSLGNLLEVVNSDNDEVNFTGLDNSPTLHTYNGSRVLTGVYRNGSSIDVTIAGQTAAIGPLTLSGTFAFDQVFARSNDVNPMTGKFQEMVIWPSDIR